MKNIKKLVVNHFLFNPGFSNGVTNYIKSVNDLIDTPYEEVIKPHEMGMVDFRKYIFKLINSNGEFKNSIIEAAESQSSTLLLSNRTNVHIRLHCPFHLYKRVINEEPDEARFSDECRAIFKAKAVSSPSHAMLELLNDDLDVDNIHVYKNPVRSKIEYFKRECEKDIDVIFLSRFNNLKGIEYIEEVISALPANFNVLIIGKQELEIRFSKAFDNVIFIDHIEGDEKYDYLSRAKVAISLSKFENCSMAILEALSVYTPVVAWDVGGNAELAPPTILKAIPLGDTLSFASAIISMHEKYIDPNEFDVVCDALNKDFIDGITFIENKIIDNKKGVYKGLDYRERHSEEIYIPSELSNDIKSDKSFPLNIGFLTSSLKSSRRFYSSLENTSFNINVIYSGGYGREISNLEPVLIGKDTTPEKVIEIINKCKIDVLVVDYTYKSHINDLYKIKQKTKKPLLYTFTSPLNKDVLHLDSIGFYDKSDLYNRRIYANPREMVIAHEKKILIWAKDCDDVIISDEVNQVISHFGQIDIAANNNIVECFSIENPSVTFNYIDSESIDSSKYTDIICYSDNNIDVFLMHPSNIYFEHKSILSKKGVGNKLSDILGDGVCYSYSNRMRAIDFVNYSSISKNNTGYIDMILKSYFRNERLVSK